MHCGTINIVDRSNPELVELEQLLRDYQSAMDEIDGMELSDVLRVARMLEAEARYMGRIMECRAAIEARIASKTRPR